MPVYMDQMVPEEIVHPQEADRGKEDETIGIHGILCRSRLLEPIRDALLGSLDGASQNTLLRRLERLCYFTVHGSSPWNPHACMHWYVRQDHNASSCTQCPLIC